MPEITSISPVNLLIDEENPRISQPNVGQHKAIQALAHHQQRKLQILARDIVLHGLNPTELSIVMPYEDDLHRYVVLEGNRRLVALKALENPEVLVDAVTKGVLTEIRKLSREYQNNPIESVQCYVVKDRDEARHWIELRHTTGNEGAGIERWGSDEAARFRARTSGLAIHQQALNFLEKRGDLSPETRRKVPTTNFQRLIDDPDVRSRLGVEVKERKLLPLADEGHIAKAMLYVINDLASGKTRVGDIYTKAQRVKYAKKIPANVVVTPTIPSGHGNPLGSGVAHTKAAPTAGTKPSMRLRDKLIPRDCVLNTTDPRIRNIERELRRLNMNEYTNAVSVLFRVFIELSADEYMDRMKLPTPPKLPLAKKLEDVVNNLLSRQKLSGQQAKPVRRAYQQDSFLAPSVTLMHNYVHNQYMFPAPGDLRAQWDSLQPFIIAMWSA
jgi:hypothetical protein